MTTNPISRRSFVAGAALAAGTVSAVADVPETWDLETDVLCLGGGATGLTAALWAKYSGVEALVLEKGESSPNSCSALADGQLAIDELEGSAPAPALETPPFHAIEVCAAIYPTQMRLNSDAKAQVRNTYGEVIPGLYAGGLMGNIGIRNPNSGQVAPALTGAFALGYIAGQEAAAQEPWE